MQEAIQGDGHRFGDELRSCVPRQKEVDCNTLEFCIDEHWRKIEEVELYSGDDEHTLESAKLYQASVTLEKLQNLYRYGWRLAEKLTGGMHRNGSILGDFITYWNAFCKANEPEQIAALYKGIVFKIYKDVNGLLSWRAEFIPQNVPSSERANPVKLEGGPDGVPEKMRYLYEEYNDAHNFELKA